MKLVDAALIAKWKKPGYERLCSTYVINTKNYKFGTVSICRVPKQGAQLGSFHEVGLHAGDSLKSSANVARFAAILGSYARTQTRRVR